MFHPLPLLSICFLPCPESFIFSPLGTCAGIWLIPFPHWIHLTHHHPRAKLILYPLFWGENVDNFFCFWKTAPKVHRTGEMPYIMVTAGSCVTKGLAVFSTPATLSFLNSDKVVCLLWTGHFLTYYIFSSLVCHISFIFFTFQFNSYDFKLELLDNWLSAPIVWFPPNMHTSLVLFFRHTHTRMKIHTYI